MQIILPVAAGLLSLCIGLLALLGARKLFVYKIFVLGMFILAAEQVCAVLAARSASPGEFMRWELFKMLAGSFVPGAWLTFSICYAREDFRKNLARFRWALTAAFIVPAAAAVVSFRSPLISQSRVYHQWIVSFGWPAYLYNLSILFLAILILINLEKTLRSSSGAIRWQIKFMVLGVGVLIAARIYCTAERLLFAGDHSRLLTVDSGTLVLADILIAVAVLRTRLRNINVYVSGDFIYNSIIVLIVGIYLLAFGVAAKLAQYFVSSSLLLDNAFLIFIAFVGIAVLFLSQGIKFKLKRFISRHFKRPVYDYKKILGSFTTRTTSLVDLHDLCNTVARTASEVFGVSHSSVWLNDEVRNEPVMFGSTHLFPYGELDPELESEVRYLALYLRQQKTVLNLDSPRPGAGGEVFPKNSADRICCCAPLLIGGEFLGIITLGRKTTGEEFTLEDLDLLKMIADQAAGMILNHRLFESLGRAREMEAFQAVSAFLAHDLKNVASTLSLTLANLPVHYEDPEFRTDALRVMSKSVEKIRNMLNRLSAVDQKLELRRSICNLNELVADTVSGISLGCPIVTDLSPVPDASFDPEQIRTVLLNIILNAGESAADRAEIQVATRRKGDCLLLSVADKGCGMSREFMDKHLFHPFKTSKDHGSGIGLYQCKAIVEAHGGRIEVQSREGCGSTFSVILPLA
ncbi:MAG TPA: XrtA/PEP-CTERM system histidine kinase PrsK [Syntrophobacteraceae bacterium]|nr:XrtA/PEP-CTERM system histidine kinase PrsK [Syntrophobacteraceae bacterium]